MAETSDLLPLIEETLELQRETHTKVSGIEIQLRNVADKVEKHDVSLYHADEGGVVGRLGRIEDHLSAKIDTVKSDADAKLKALEAKVTPMIWVGGVLAFIVVTWFADQLLNLIKP